MTQIDTGTIGPLNGNTVTFRFITPFESQTSTSTRATPTHNIVNDLSWLKGKHTHQGRHEPAVHAHPEHAQQRFVPERDRQSVVGGRRRPDVHAAGARTARRRGAPLYPAVASTFGAGYADAWLNILGVLSQANLRANYDRDGNILPVGEPDLARSTPRTNTSSTCRTRGGCRRT